MGVADPPPAARAVGPGRGHRRAGDALAHGAAVAGPGRGAPQPCHGPRRRAGRQRRVLGGAAARGRGRAREPGLHGLGDRGRGDGDRVVAWQHLHALNARALARGADGLGPGWAIGGWFIPVANLVIPAAQIAGANRAVEPYVPVGPQHRPGAGTGLVVWWAVPFGLATVVDRVAWILHPDLWRAGPRDVRRVLSEAAGADRWAALAALLFVVAAIAAMVMVWRLTARQDAAIGNVQHLVLAPPPADGWRPPAPRPPRGPRRHRRPPPGGRGRGRRPAARRAASGRPRRPGPSRPSWRGRGAGARPGP
nr:DUF4328 domain-containing protein [Thermoanaerobacterales bacterium]